LRKTTRGTGGCAVVARHSVVLSAKRSVTNRARTNAAKATLFDFSDDLASIADTPKERESNEPTGSMVTPEEKLKCGNACNSCLREVKRVLVKPDVTTTGKAHG